MTDTDRRLILLAEAATAITQCAQLIGETWTALILDRINEVYRDVDDDIRADN